MIIGAFYLTELVEAAKGEGRVFRHIHELERAFEAGDARPARRDRVPRRGRRHRGCRLKTTDGRLLFNAALPDDFEYVNRAVKKGDMGQIVDDLANGKRGLDNGDEPELIHGYPKAVVADALDAIKNLCFRFATRSGLTISIDDVKTPAEKSEILDRHEKEAEKVETQFLGASSPTVSGARRKSRSGRPPPKRCGPRWRASSSRTSSTPST